MNPVHLRALRAALGNIRWARWYLGDGANPAGGINHLADAMMFLGTVASTATTTGSWRRCNRLVRRMMVAAVGQ